MERRSFVFYASWLEAIENLPTDMQGDALFAIAKYGIRGEEVACIKPIAKAMLTMVKAQIDANNSRYEAGCKGGAPRGNQNARKQPKNNQKQPTDNQKTTKNNLMRDDRCKMKKNKEREKENSHSLSSFFSSFWGSYPETARKTAKQKAECLEFWRENELDEKSAFVMNALEYWKKTPQWSDPDYIPSPINWMRKEPWTADIDSAEKSADEKTVKLTDKEARELEYEYERLLNTAHALGLNEEQLKRLDEVKETLKKYKGKANK